MDGDTRMSYVNITWSKITIDTTTWPLEGDTVFINDGTCIIRVGNKARGINFIVDDFILSYIGMEWCKIPVSFNRIKHVIFPVDKLPEKEPDEQHTSRIVLLKCKDIYKGNYFIEGYYDFYHEKWKIYRGSYVLTEDVWGWMEVPE